MTQSENIKRKSVGGALSYSLRTGLVYVIALIATGILSAWLTPAEFGVFFIVTAIITFFTFLSDVGLAAALVQKKTEPSLTELRTTFTVQQLLALIIFGLVIALTPVWRSQMKLNQDGLWLLYALGFSFFLASLKTIPSILLERELNFARLAVPQVVEQLVYYLVVVWLAYHHFGVISFTGGVLVRGVIGVIMMYSLKRWSMGLALNRAALKGLLTFGVKFQANDFLARLKDDLYFIILAKFMPVTYMGYLGWAKRWSLFPYQFSVQNIIAVTFPTFARVQQDKAMISRGLEVSVYFISLIIFPILAGMMVLALPITIAIPAYQKWQPALPALYFFCLNIALAAVANPFISALNAMGQINATLRLMIAMTLGTWLLTPIMVRYFDFVGVAILSSLVAAGSLVGYRIIKQKLSVRLWPQVALPLSLSLVTGVTLWLYQQLTPVNLTHLGLQLVLGSLIHLGGWWFWGRRRLAANLNLILPPGKLNSWLKKV